MVKYAVKLFWLVLPVAIATGLYVWTFNALQSLNVPIPLDVSGAVSA